MLLLLLALVTATEVIRYTPTKPLPARSRSGHCWTSSIAAPYREDAWRCFVGNEIHDPCFSVAQHDRVICDMNPATGSSGFQLKLTQPLPEPETPPAANTNWAWLIELADGTICTPFTGTSALVNGEAAHYGCASRAKKEIVVLVGDLVRTGQTWTAKKAVLSLDGKVIQPADTVILLKVWQ